MALACHIGSADVDRWQATVPGRDARTLRVDLGRSAGWYDVSVILSASPRYLRRFAGHHEDGRAATSDPGPGA
jgi:phospholipase C